MRKAALPLGFEKGKGKGKTMEISLLLMQQIAQLFLILIMGYAVVKAGLLKASDSRVLSVVMVYLVTPCVIINAFQIDDTPEIRKGTFVLHGYCGGYPCSAAGAQRPAEPPAQAGCRGTGECDLQQRRCTGDPVGQGSDGRCVCHLLLRIHHCAAGAAVDPRQFPFAGQQCAGLEKRCSPIST